MPRDDVPQDAEYVDDSPDEPPPPSVPQRDSSGPKNASVPETLLDSSEPTSTGEDRVTDSTGSVLTDGTGISSLTSSKLLKDFVADFLLTAAATFVTANITSIQDAVQAPQLAIFSVVGALGHAAFRFVMKWTNS